MGEIETLPQPSAWSAYFELAAEPFTGPPRYPAGSSAAQVLAGLVASAAFPAQVSLLRTYPGSGASSALAALAAECLALGRTVVMLPAEGGRLPRRVLLALGLGEIAGDEVDIHNILRVFLLNEFARGRLPTLILENAHRCSVRELSALLGLLKLRYQGDLAVKLVLAGAPELEDRLTASELAPLAARCTAPAVWPALDRDEFRQWAGLCAEAAGAQQPLFSAMALDQVHEVSGGATDTAACLLRRALVVAQAHGERLVTRHTLQRLFSPLHRQEPAEQTTAAESPRLTIRRGSRFLTELNVEAPRLVLGRDASADVVLHDAWVSRYHALLIRDARGLWLADLHSTNGTRVNGKPVHMHRLQHGEVIRLGQYAIEVDCPQRADSGEAEMTRQLPQIPAIRFTARN
jgi:hypothetical protein